MKIIKRINTNAAIALDSKGRKAVVLGKGVGFPQVPYELTDLSKIQRTFYEVSPQYYDMLTQLPREVLLVSADIVERAEISLGVSLNPNLSFSLADHIAFALQRESQGICLAMPLSYDVRHIYPKEYELGQYAVQLIKTELGTQFSEGEAVRIALHLVNAEMEGSDLTSMLESLEMISEINKIVEQELGIRLDKESYNYSRFVTHLQFLIQRLSTNRHVVNDTGNMLQEIIREYPKIYACSLKITEYFRESKGWECGKDEILYLSLHINRVFDRK